MYVARVADEGPTLYRRFISSGADNGGDQLVVRMDSQVYGALQRSISLVLVVRDDAEKRLSSVGRSCDRDLQNIASPRFTGIKSLHLWD